MKAIIRGKPLEAQARFLRLRSFFAAMFGGYGSGKTHGLVYKLFQLADANPGLPGGLVCPTMKMFKRDVYPLLRHECAKSDIEFEYRRSDAELYFPTTDTTCYIFHGEDDGESIAGPNLAWMLLNEATLMSHNTFKSAVARVRLKDAPFPQVAMSGTPNDFNWAYDNFIDKPMEGSAVVFADTRKNIHTGDWYVNMLMNSYDDIAKQMFIEGKFVPKAGNRALHQFDRHKHSAIADMRVKRDGFDEGEIWVSCDFNVYPMAATIWQYLPELTIPLRAIDEISIHGASTPDLCDAIRYKIGSGWQKAIIYPDPAGNARSTKIAGTTDISIMREFGFSDIRYKKALKVRDCMNAANNLFSKNKVVVHRKCEETIRDYERVKLRTGSHELDKSDPMRTHWLDGFKNMADYQFPCAKPYTEITQRKFR